jgi:hypothetical protein
VPVTTATSRARASRRCSRSRCGRAAPRRPRFGTLTARNPTRWAQSGAYIAWNQIVGAGELLSASYSLTAPDWAALPGGRDPSVTYKVRVVFAIGGGERTVEKQAVVSAFSDPAVVT